MTYLNHRLNRLIKRYPFWVAILSTAFSGFAVVIILTFFNNTEQKTTENNTTPSIIYVADKINIVYGAQETFQFDKERITQIAKQAETYWGRISIKPEKIILSASIVMDSGRLLRSTISKFDNLMFELIIMDKSIKQTPEKLQEFIEKADKAEEISEIAINQFRSYLSLIVAFESLCNLAMDKKAQDLPVLDRPTHITIIESFKKISAAFKDDAQGYAAEIDKVAFDSKEISEVRKVIVNSLKLTPLS